MPRYVAFLRGVSPMIAKNIELKRSFEGAGFTDVKTMLSSGNVVFNARAKSETALVRQAEAAMARYLGRTFYTIVRPARVLQDLIEADPYAVFHLPANAKRVRASSTCPARPDRGRPLRRLPSAGECEASRYVSA